MASMRRTIRRAILRQGLTHAERKQMTNAKRRAQGKPGKR